VDAVITGAVRRIEFLEAELSRLQAFVATYRELQREFGPTAEPKSADQTIEHVAKDEHAGGAPADNDDETPRPTPQAQLEDAVVEIIAANGAPMKRMELFERVKARGLSVGGTKELINFGSKLSRFDRLINLNKRGYWPKDRPFAPVGYVPVPSGPPGSV